MHTLSGISWKKSRCGRQGQEAPCPLRAFPIASSPWADANSLATPPYNCSIGPCRSPSRRRLSLTGWTIPSTVEGSLRRPSGCGSAVMNWIWQTTRQVLSKKCKHMRLPEPSLEAFLSPTMLQEAAAYWSQDLIGQVPGGNLPAWDAVTAELRRLLADFLSR